MTLTKADRTEAINRELGFQKKQSMNLVEGLVGIIKRTLASGEDVLISGVGKFHVREKRARKGRNPATGDDIMLWPRRVVVFKCSAKMCDRINGN